MPEGEEEEGGEGGRITIGVIIKHNRHHHRQNTLHTTNFILLQASIYISIPNILRPAFHTSSVPAPSAGWWEVIGEKGTGEVQLSVYGPPPFVAQHMRPDPLRREAVLQTTPPSGAVGIEPTNM